jgi:hypothetical protein
MRFIVIACVALFALLVPAPPAVAQSTASVNESADIGTLDEAGFTVPFAINNHGTIVGAVEYEDLRSRAFVWTRRTGFEVIAEGARAWDVNDGGVVVGEMHGPVTTGFAWTRARGFTDLGTFIPFAINNAGVMAGLCVTTQQPCIWKRGVLTALTNVEGSALDINARGDIVGSTLSERAFLWTRDGQFVDLGPGLAEDINNRGTIAGMRHDGTVPVGAIWARTGALTLAPFPSFAQAVNERGWALLARADDASVWNPHTGALVDLDSSRGGVILSFDMNDRGEVVGIVDVAGISRVVIWRINGKHLNR